MKFKKIVLTILSVTLMVSILSASASAVYFGANKSGEYSGIALLEPTTASCSATTTYNYTYSKTSVIEKHTVVLQARFANETVINKQGTAYGRVSAAVTANSLLGNAFSWAESIHTQTVDTITYRKDLSA